MALESLLEGTLERCIMSYGLGVGLGLGLVSNVLLVLVCVLGGIVLWMHVKRSRLPPGPFPLPFVGNPQPASVRPGLDIWYEQLRAQYGDVFTLHCGMKPIVMVAGYDSIQELLVKNSDGCCIRDCHNTFSCLHNNQGLVWTAHHWLAQRKLTLRVWNQQDWGRIIGSETHKFVKWLASHGTNKSSDVAEMAQHMMARNLCSVLCKDKDWREHITHSTPVESSPSAGTSTYSRGGQCPTLSSSPYTSEKTGFYRAVKLNERALGTLQPKLFVPYLIPVLRRLPGDLFGWKTFQKAKLDLWSEVQSHVDEHRKERRDCGDARDDFIDAWLAASETVEELMSGKQSADDGLMTDDRSQSSAKVLQRNPFNDGDCVATLIQLVTAGADTLTSMIMWGLVYLIRYPHCQAKLQHEIDTIIGCDRAPSPDDRQCMPYTEAIITEVLRISRGTFVSLPYLTVKPISVGGHFIPSGTCVQAWLDSVHSDPKEYQDPGQFKPERYLNENGKFVKPDHFLPFSLGRRSCIGEAVARTVAFLVFTTIFQKLSIASGEAGLPSTDPMPGFLWAPQPFTIRAEPRRRQAHLA